MPNSPQQRSNIWTIISVALIACAAADMVHELLGHGLASWLTHNPILSISTVAVQNAFPSRFVATCGTSANFLVGTLALLLLRRAKAFTISAFFLWLFAAFNLLNSGYLISSAILLDGDWGAVIGGLQPPLVWRLGLGILGVILYYASLRWLAQAIQKFSEAGKIGSGGQLGRLVIPGYLTAGLLMTTAAVFNPISPSLILASGAAASLGLNFGLLFVPAIATSQLTTLADQLPPLPFSVAWIISAILVATAFVGILGHGIKF